MFCTYSRVVVCMLSWDLSSLIYKITAITVRFAVVLRVSGEA